MVQQIPFPADLEQFLSTVGGLLSTEGLADLASLLAHAEAHAEVVAFEPWNSEPTKWRIVLTVTPDHLSRINSTAAEAFIQRDANKVIAQFPRHTIDEVHVVPKVPRVGDKPNNPRGQAAGPRSDLNSIFQASFEAATTEPQIAFTPTRSSPEASRDVSEGRTSVRSKEQAPQAIETAKGHTMEPKTRTASILFMDVSGWSKLNARTIYEYVTKAMPELAKQISGQDLTNTWGDSIVATFGSAKDAAESALRIKQFFLQGYQHAGIAEGLTCRISLHHGEVILCQNPLKGGEDIFGDAVHMAARLEPATAPGHVFCTAAFAALLKSVSGLAPKAWPLPRTLRLPKGYGDIEASAVTWPNEPDPRPGLAEFLDPPVASPTVGLPTNIGPSARDLWVTAQPRYMEAIKRKQASLYSRETDPGLPPAAYKMANEDRDREKIESAKNLERVKLELEAEYDGTATRGGR